MNETLKLLLEKQKDLLVTLNYVENQIYNLIQAGELSEEAEQKAVEALNECLL